MNKISLPIDGEKLNEILRKKQIKKKTASEAMGYCSAYLTWAIGHNSIAKAATVLLRTMYKIDYESYKPTEDEDEEELAASTKDNKSAIDYDKLNEVLYDAVFRAVRDALKE